MKLLQALHHSHKAHQFQRDKKGYPYILHPVAVSYAVASRGERVMCLALLHDVEEDQPDYELPNDSITPGERRSLDLLRRDDDQTYREYIFELIEDEDACWVKLGDGGHNLHPKRALKNSPSLAEERYYPYLSLVVSALVEIHGASYEEIEEVLYAHPYPYNGDEDE